MAKQVINIGQTANDKSGDPLRTAFNKVNANFTELYSAIGADVQIPIQTGNDGKFLTTNGTNLSWATLDVTGNTLVNGTQSLVLGPTGTLTISNFFPRSFTATLDAAHHSGALALSGSAWHFAVTFNLTGGGSIENVITNNTPWVSNPGYTNGMTFTFTEADHGIPNYAFTLSLEDIQNPGPMMWTTNLAASQPPVAPSTLKSTDDIKLTSNDYSWVLGTNGDLATPDGHIGHDGLGNLVLASKSLSKSVKIWSGQGMYSWDFGADGKLTIPGTIVVPNDTPLSIQTTNTEVPPMGVHHLNLSAGNIQSDAVYLGLQTNAGQGVYIYEPDGYISVGKLGTVPTKFLYDSTTPLGRIGDFEIQTQRVQAGDESSVWISTQSRDHQWRFGGDGYLTMESLHLQGFLKGVDGSTGSTGQVLTCQSNGGVAWVDASAASTGDIRFTGHKIHEASLGTVSIQTTADPSHWWSEYGELLYNTADSWGSGIEYDSAGNMYVIGGTYHDDGTGNSTNIKSILIKYSSAGAVVWAKTITDPDDLYLRGEGIWVDGNDYIYLMLTNDDTNWSYILKVNGSGTIIWQKKIDAATDGNLRFTDIDGGNGHIYIAGSNNYVAADARTEFFVGAFSTTDGSCVWQQTIADIVAPGYHTINTLGVAYGGDANQVYITGYAYNSEVNDQDNGLLISMSAADGSITWSKQISFPGYDWYLEGNDVAVDPNSGYVYTVGEHSSGLSLIKFDPSGNIIWQKVINKYSNTYGNSLDFDSSGNVYLTGTTSNSANTNFRRAWVIIKFDTSGNILWQRSFGSGLANTYQWYYDGHKEIALHGDVFAVTGYTYAGPHAGSLSNSSILTAQLPIDGSKTGSYDSFSYEPTDFTAADDTLSTNDVTYTATVSTYTITTPSLAVANAGEDSNLYPFSGDTWNFNPGAILELPGGGDIVDSNTGNSVINVLRSGVHTATMNSVGVLVDETGRSLTGESNGRIASGRYWNNIPLQIRHATGYKHLEDISSPQDWLDLADVATQIGVANSNWITGMIIEFQAFASGNIVGVNWQNSYMTGQIIIANSGDGRMSLTHSEAAISNYDGNANDLVWSGMDLWIKDLSQGQKIAVARTDGHTLEQLDIQWTARVFTNPAEYFC